MIVKYLTLYLIFNRREGYGHVRSESGCKNPGYVAQRIAACEQEIQKGMIGQQEIIRQVMIAMLTGGNVLLEGMPGLGKTRLVSTIAKVFDLSFKRIQFTPDLLPSDITGSDIYIAARCEFEFRKGPIFANMVLADEINRAPAKDTISLAGGNGRASG